MVSAEYLHLSSCQNHSPLIYVHINQLREQAGLSYGTDGEMELIKALKKITCEFEAAQVLSACRTKFIIKGEKYWN